MVTLFKFRGVNMMYLAAVSGIVWAAIEEFI